MRDGSRKGARTMAERQCWMRGHFFDVYFFHLSALFVVVTSSYFFSVYSHQPTRLPSPLAHSCSASGARPHKCLRLFRPQSASGLLGRRIKRLGVS